MTTINTSYGNIFFHDVIDIAYDDVAHVVISGTRRFVDPPIPSGLSEGSYLAYQQDVGTDHWKLRVINVAPYAVAEYFSTAVACDLVIEDVIITPAMNGNPGQVQVVASGTGTYRFSIGGTPQASATILNVNPGAYYVTLSRTEDGCYVQRFITVPGHADLLVAYVVYNCTANGADDGRIDIGIGNGSGDYTIAYSGGPTINLLGPVVTGHIRTNLPPDTYNVTVTDNITGQIKVYQLTVTEPGIVQPPPLNFGTVFHFPFGNSITFVNNTVISCDVPQGLDNVLFYDQIYKGVERVRYYQKFNRCDRPLIQFNSNFNINEIELHKCDGTFVKNFLIEMKEENIGKTQTFDCLITNHTDNPGKSRVYFNSTAIPLPVSVNDTFEIFENADGFNGTYSILEIKLDALLGKQYLVITKNYVLGVASTNAKAKFSIATVNYNVYETIIGFLDVPDGNYYFYARGFSTGNLMDAVSEPFMLKEEHAGVVKVECRHARNGHAGLTWSTGYTAMYRVEGHWGNIRTPGGELVVNRNADNSLTVVSSKPTRPVVLTLTKLPPYLLEKLGLAFKSTYQAINAIEVATSEGMQEPTYVEKTRLANASIKVEQKNWFGPFTNTGIGTVVDGGFITTETGFLKR